MQCRYNISPDRLSDDGGGSSSLGQGDDGEVVESLSAPKRKKRPASAVIAEAERSRRSERFKPATEAAPETEEHREGGDWGCGDKRDAVMRH